MAKTKVADILDKAEPCKYIAFDTLNGDFINDLEIEPKALDDLKRDIIEYLDTADGNPEEIANAIEIYQFTGKKIKYEKSISIV